MLCHKSHLLGCPGVCGEEAPVDEASVPQVRVVRVLCGQTQYLTTQNIVDWMQTLQ